MKIKFKVDSLIEVMVNETKSETISDYQTEFDGTVTLEMPSFKERARIPLSLGIDKIAAMGDNKDPQEVAKNALAQVEFLEKGADLVEKYIIDCDLLDKETGEKLTTKEELLSHPSCTNIIMAIIMKFNSGFVSKKKKPLPSSK